MTNNINAFITFSQSKKYPTDWKVRTVYKNGYDTILTVDEVSKNTKFGTKIDLALAKDYARSKAQQVVNGFGQKVNVTFA